MHGRRFAGQRQAPPRKLRKYCFDKTFFPLKIHPARFGKLSYKNPLIPPEYRYLARLGE
jgi:hypothetical protein